MIFGKTDEQIQKEINGKQNPHDWFAWFPVVLMDGRWAWLETIDRSEVYSCGSRVYMYTLKPDTSLKKEEYVHFENSGKKYKIVEPVSITMPPKVYPFTVWFQDVTLTDGTKRSQHINVMAANESDAIIIAQAERIKQWLDHTVQRVEHGMTQ